MAIGRQEITHLRWEVELDLVAGELDATFVSKVPPGAMKAEQVSLLLNPGMEVTAVEYELGGAAGFAARRVAFPESAEVLQVLVPFDAARNGSRLSVSYRGHLEDRSRFHRYLKDRISTQFTLLRHDSFCYPLFAESSFDSLRRSITATRMLYELRVSYSNGLEAVSPGELVATDTEADRTIRTFRSVIPALSMVCALGRYTQLREDGLSFWLLADEPDVAARQVFARYAACGRLYRELLGEPLHTIAPLLIELPEGYGCSAAPDAVLLARDELRDSKDYRVLYHELAHGWGPWRGPRWVHEGFAEFLALTAVGRLDGPEQAEARWRQAERDYRHVIERDPSQAGIGDGDRSAYSGGALFMKDLCDELGYDAMARIMRHCQETEGPETPEAFRRRAESVTGRDLSKVFARWGKPLPQAQ